MSPKPENTKQFIKQTAKFQLSFMLPDQSKKIIPVKSGREFGLPRANLCYTESLFFNTFLSAGTDKIAIQTFPFFTRLPCFNFFFLLRNGCGKNTNTERITYKLPLVQNVCSLLGPISCPLVFPQSQ